MRKVVLHIGMHKTGTTSIQKSLYNLDRDGFRTIRFAEKNHSIPIRTIFSENRLNISFWKKRGFNKNQVMKKKAEYEKILEEEIRDESVKCFLLSGEAISTLAENEQLNLCEFFKKRNLKVRVIYVVREPFSWATSANQQRAKGGSAKALAKINPNYKKRILGFIKGCGCENISIFKYEQLIQGGLIKAFSEIIGVTLDEKPRYNESMTAEALGLTYALNNIKSSTRGTKLKLNARRRVIDAIRSFFSESNGFKKLNLKKFDIVHQDVGKDLVWLDMNFGLSYQLPVIAEQQELMYDECPSTESLSEFFGVYNLNYDESASLAYNMEKFYLRFLLISKTKSQIKNLIKADKKLDASKLFKKIIELGDERHTTYRQASNISHHLKEIDDAIAFAKQAVSAKDNDDKSRARHKKHLANMFHVAGKLDDTLSFVDEY
jgi:hypothetical protein